MNGGLVHGIGMKGKVMDYGTTTYDLDSLQHTPLSHVKTITLYVLEKNDIVEQQMHPDLLHELVNYDTHQQYVIKEFVTPFITSQVLGYTKKEYMRREIDAFRRILSIVKKHNVVGMPYKKTILFGMVIEMEYKTRCFVINRKCKEVMSEQKVNSFTEKEFVHFVKDILKLLIDIQKHGLAHGDIKLDNIMKCGTHYELIDWENSRKLDYSLLTEHRYLGLSPFYFKILYGVGWYAAFKVALLKYYSETGGYDTRITSQYADHMIDYYTSLFKEPMKKTFDTVKYSLDLCAFGMILYGIMRRNPLIHKKHHFFIMNVYKMKNAKIALNAFTAKTRKRL